MDNIKQIIYTLIKAIEVYLKARAENYMGRKKNPPKEIETTQEGETEMKEVLNELKQTAPLTETALGISKTRDGWAVVEIAFNSETGESDLQDVRIAGISRDDAIELFKITAVEKGIV